MSTTEAFLDRPHLAARYEQERRAQLVDRLGVTCRIAIVLIPVFFVLDVLLAPESLPTLLAIRITMTALAAAALFLLRHPVGQRLALTLSYVTVCQTGCGVILMTVFVGGAMSPYYAGVNLVMLAAAVLLPWDSTVSALSATTLIAVYVATCLLWGGPIDVSTLVVHLFFLCATAIITVASHHTGARARQHEFLQRVALEEAGRHRDEFLANITHELRTPLAAILGYTDMLREFLDNATTDQRSWLERIHGNAMTLYRLIVQLLDFSKIEAGALKVDCVPFDLAAIVTKVARDMRAIAGEGGTAIHVRIPDDTPPVLGDAGRVEEIVGNLAANALKFAGTAPITLAISTGPVEHGASWHRIVPSPGPDAESKTYVQVTVIDHGEGIRSDDLRRLFVAFQQLDGSSTRRKGGTGLGLAISARLAAAMHGHVAVRSTPGMGSTFALLLPAAPADRPVAAVDPTPPEAAGVAASAAD